MNAINEFKGIVDPNQRIHERTGNGEWLEIKKDVIHRLDNGKVVHIKAGTYLPYADKHSFNGYYGILRNGVLVHLTSSEVNLIAGFWGVWGGE